MFRLNNYYKLGVVSSIMYTYTKAFGPLAYLIIVYNKRKAWNNNYSGAT